ENRAGAGSGNGRSVPAAVVLVAGERVERDVGHGRGAGDSTGHAEPFAVDALAGRPGPFHGSDAVIFAKATLWTTGVTTLVWVTVTLLTPPEDTKTLVDFYRRVKPDILGWG